VLYSHRGYLKNKVMYVLYSHRDYLTKYSHVCVIQSPWLSEK
jgi:hypothetical protein